MLHGAMLCYAVLYSILFGFVRLDVMHCYDVLCNVALCCVTMLFGAVLNDIKTHLLHNFVAKPRGVTC